MRDQEILDLQEAYASIYESGQTSEYITEEANIAAEYFYHLGLNEHGVDILIDELGLNEFVEFVEDIAENYYLTEEEGATAAPKPRRTRKPKAETTGESPAPDAPARKPRTRKPPTPKTTAQRNGAVKDAVEKQPESSAPPQKRPMLDAIARQVTKGMERHRKATKGLGKAASETGKLIGNLARGAAAVTGGAASGVAGATGIAGHLASKGLKKEDFEMWVNSLVEEGYDLSEYTWDDMCGIYMEEVEQLEEGRWNNPRWNEHDRQRKAADQADRDRGLPQSYTDRRNRRRLAMGEYSPSAPHSERQEAGRQNLRDQGKVPKKVNKKTGEKKDMFEQVLEHLVAEGYADTNEAALVIMANMSEEWRQSIVEVYDDNFAGGGGTAKMNQTGMTRSQVTELGKKQNARLDANELNPNFSKGQRARFERRTDAATKEYQKGGGDTRARKLGITPDNAAYVTGYHGGPAPFKTR